MCALKGATGVWVRHSSLQSRPAHPLGKPWLSTEPGRWIAMTTMRNSWNNWVSGSVQQHVEGCRAQESNVEYVYSLCHPSAGVLRFKPNFTNVILEWTSCTCKGTNSSKSSSHLLFSVFLSRCVGINMVKRKLAAHDNLKITIESNGNTFHIKEHSNFRNLEIDFTLGVTFEYSLADGTELSVSKRGSVQGECFSVATTTQNPTLQPDPDIFLKLTSEKHWVILTTWFTF